MDTGELEGFKDFTVSSSWERLIASVETLCRDWLAAGRKKLLSHGAKPIDGVRNLHLANAEVSQGSKKYRLELFFAEELDQSQREGGDWSVDSHHLQLWFGVNDFMVISPASLSGVVLDAPEATMLLSTVSVALSNCGSTWPIFVPVHDPTRMAYFGIESATTSSSVKFEADRLGSRVPIKLMHLEGLYELFVSKLGLGSEDYCSFGFTMRLTYGTSLAGYRLSPDPVGSPKSEPARAEDMDVDNYIWDEEFPWAEWYSLEDPIKGFELGTIWKNRDVSTALELAEFENASTFDADLWMLKLLFPREDEEKKTGFSARLRRLVQSFVLSKGAEYMEDYVNVVKPSIEQVVYHLKVPPSTVLDRVLKDIFIQAPQASSYDSSNLRMVKGAPPDSLFGRFCLHALWFGDCNIRAIAYLWNEFIREVRWCWEEVQPLPRHSPGEPPDFGTCLAQQKLQLLAGCIDPRTRKQSSDSNLQSWLDRDASDTNREDTSKNDMKPPSSSKRSKVDSQATDDKTDRRGSAGPIGSLTLAISNKPIHAPVTQEPPLITEDMLHEREQALAALDRSPSGNAARIRLQSDILTSDMSAFKAANPGAVLEDFVKWHSPRDWVEDDSVLELQKQSKGKGQTTGRLSRRMSEPGNAWAQLWESVKPVPASRQKLLFDYNREGEKVIHYLDTLRPHQLLAQILCATFVNVVWLLSKTPGCSIEPLASKFDDLYAIMAVVLAPLGELAISDKQVEESLQTWERDLMELCNALESLEKDVALAASLNQKLPQASSRLLSAVISSQSKCAPVAFYTDREVIANTLFSTQNVSQTWEESLRMGNFLNGHEPLVREIIFRHYQGQVEGYAQTSDQAAVTNRPSHRMYIRGTADDLQIAMASSAQD